MRRCALLIALVLVDCRTALYDDGSQPAVTQINDGSPSPDLVLPLFDLALPLPDFALPLPDLAMPPVDTALYCDGSTTSITLPVTGLIDNPDAMTIELWLRDEAPLPIESPEEYLIYSPPTEGTADNLSVRIADYLQAGRRTNHCTLAALAPTGVCTQGDSIASYLNVSASVWNHLALTRALQADGTITQRLYTNGALDNHGSFPAGCVDPTEITLCHGLMNTKSTPFHGAIDELRISKVVRYTGNFQPTRPVADADTILLLHFETLPLVDDGPNAIPITSTGNVQLVPAIHG